MDSELQKKFQQIKTFILDVDGVLTDGSLLALESGEQVRTFNIKDGYGIEQAIKAGYRVAIISGSHQVGVRKRLEFLKITDIYLGVRTDSKIGVFELFIQENGLLEEEVLYMGDDIPDYWVMQRNVLAACPADAVADIREISQYVSPFNGGWGAVRDVIEKVMRAQGKWVV